MDKDLAQPPLPTAGEQWALFIDIDGTLVELVAHPGMVRVDAYTRSLLERLQPLLGGALAVLSGRSLSDVDRLLEPLLLPAGALHGLELRDSAGTLAVPAPAPEIVATVARMCQEAARGMTGLWVEVKSGIGFALHYRTAPRQAAAVQALAHAVAASSSGAYVVQLGDCVAELKLSGSDKGTALRMLFGQPPFAGRRPIMLGDDLTDEAAFAVAQELGGLSIIVGARRPTHATSTLASPRAVLEWLGALTRQLEQRQASE